MIFPQGTKRVKLSLCFVFPDTQDGLNISCLTTGERRQTRQYDGGDVKDRAGREQLGTVWQQLYDFKHLNTWGGGVGG